ncbi:PEP-CTERM sorting domain-containing protein [Colwellia sp. MSW7]|uniref:PEP-CTERM sorting domain-containing protein n=1 Tax=Colwellia maritima TaxID=2912588 RepID=A0ABS9WZY0_9GAMM|nr:PEP-CTERM sorting domain-containing protein [Colwellia maritima]MCI2283523.1 PEP-CTERM sorting domain-containing protein [Colwellia maritima]
MNYLTYLQSGGGMFIMGENSSFTARNNSIFSLINAAGGGSLAFSSNVTSTQTVNAPFTGPNAVTNVTYNAPGGANGHGTGSWITNSGNIGTGIAWGTGDLSNATAGALTTIFDVNFMQTTADLNSQNLTKNLIGFIDTQVNPDPTSVPEPSTFAIFLLSMIGLASRRFK